MSGFQSTPYTIPLILAAAVSVALALLVWQRRPGPSILAFVMLLVGIVVWSTGYAAELTVTDLPTKTILTAIEYLGITIVPGSWLLFVLEYTGQARMLSRRTAAFLAIEPAITVLLAFTNSTHHWLWSDVYLTNLESFSVLTTAKGPFFWVHSVYSYLILLVGAFLLFRALVRSPHLYRGQVGTILIATLAPWVTNAVYLSGLSPFPHLDPTPFAFTLTGLSLGWSLVRYRLLDIVPIARDAVIESMSDAMMVLDLQSCIVDINPAGLRALAATSTTDVIGKMPSEVMPSQRVLFEKFRFVIDTRTEISVDDNSFYEVRISPLRNQQSELTGRVVVLHDITDLKQAANKIKAQNETLTSTNRDLADARMRAEEASRLKSEFLAIMSHELRTPLNAIIGFTDLLLIGAIGQLTEPQAEHLRRVLANGERLLELVNDVLDLTRIEAARVELARNPFSPDTVLKSVQKKIQSLADKKSLELITHLDPALPPQLMGDQRRIEQILANLIGNAIRFTEAGQIDVYFAQAGTERWSITVSDTGIGIPPDALGYIFEAFRQVDSSSKRQYDGTGLGLAIVLKLAELMGGTVSVKSIVGKGSTFSVLLPLMVAETQMVQME